MDFNSSTVVVAGLGISGQSMVDILRDRAARVISVDERKEDADLRSVNLKGADLRGARLGRARLNGSDMRGAKLGPL